MIVRRFTAEGMLRFEEFVIAAQRKYKASEPVDPVPADLLSNPQSSSETDYSLPDREVDFSDKLKIGAYFLSVIPDAQHSEARIDKEMWTWLAAYFFDQITNDREKLKETRAYVAAIGYKEFYRHLLLGPYFLFFNARDNPERVRVLLYNDPTTMNEVMVQFGSYQSLMQNKELQSVVHRLFYDTNMGKLKRGAGGKGAGSPRRLMDFFKQLELNYDLGSINEVTLWGLLPGEFSKFQS
jgi:hypothetical protein